MNTDFVRMEALRHCGGVLKTVLTKAFFPQV